VLHAQQAFKKGTKDYHFRDGFDRPGKFPWACPRGRHHQAKGLRRTMAGYPPKHGRLPFTAVRQAHVHRPCQRSPATLPYQVANATWVVPGRSTAAEPSGATIEEAVVTAVVNKRAGGRADSGPQSLQRPLRRGFNCCIPFRMSI